METAIFLIYVMGFFVAWGMFVSGNRPYFDFAEFCINFLVGFIVAVAWPIIIVPYVLYHALFKAVY